MKAREGHMEQFEGRANSAPGADCRGRKISWRRQGAVVHYICDPGKCNDMHRIPNPMSPQKGNIAEASLVAYCEEQLHECEIVALIG